MNRMGMPEYEGLGEGKDERGRERSSEQEKGSLETLLLSVSQQSQQRSRGTKHRRPEGPNSNPEWASRFRSWGSNASRLVGDGPNECIEWNRRPPECIDTIDLYQVEQAMAQF